MREFTPKEYSDFLERITSSIFKILPLYENENPYLPEYIESLRDFDIIGSHEYIQNYNYQVWYMKSLTALNALHKGLTSSEIDLTHSRVKSEVFNLTNLISKCKKELGVAHE